MEFKNKNPKHIRLKSIGLAWVCFLLPENANTY